MNKVGKFHCGGGGFCVTCESRFFIAEPTGFASASTPRFLERQGFALLWLLQFDVGIAFDEAKSAQLGRSNHAHGLVAVAMPQGARRSVVS